MNPNADVLIVTVTKVESEAVMQVFQEATGKESRSESINDRMYRDIGEINGARVFMALSEMGASGPGGSQESVGKGIEALKPNAVIMVGIAFGVNKQKQAIGDILVSQQLRLYELQRVGQEIILRGDKPHSSTKLINRFQFASQGWKGDNKIHFGTILTGEKLVDDADYLEQIKKLEPDAIGGEMEGAGLYVACQDKKVDWILVKAICDWADGNKNNPSKDKDQQTAAGNAASFVLFMLKQASLTREGFAEEERQVAHNVLTFLHNEGLFHAPYTYEFPLDCYTSADKIRDMLVNELKKVPEHSKLFSSLDQIREHCKEFMRSLRDKGLVIYGAEGLKSASFEVTSAQMNDFYDLIEKLRMDCHPYIRSLAENYGYQLSGDLKKAMDNPGK